MSKTVHIKAERVDSTGTHGVETWVQNAEEGEQLINVLYALGYCHFPNDHDEPIVSDSQTAIAEMGIAWIDTLLRKNKDYGDTVFSRPCLAPDLSPDAAIRTRMSDKIDRLINLLGGEKQNVAESIEDTVGDLGAYCLLWLINRKKNSVENQEVSSGNLGSAEINTEAFLRP